MDIWFNNITIENNVMTDLIDYAISVTRTTNWTIKYNTITNCVAGIRLKNSELKHDTYPTGKTGFNQGCSNIRIEGNKLTNITQKHGIQVYSKDKILGRTNKVTISNNTLNGVLIQNPIDLRNCDDIMIQKNTFSNFTVANPIKQSEINTNILISDNSILMN